MMICEDVSTNHEGVEVDWDELVRKGTSVQGKGWDSQQKMLQAIS